MSSSPTDALLVGDQTASVGEADVSIAKQASFTAEAAAEEQELREDQIGNAVAFLTHPKACPKFGLCKVALRNKGFSGHPTLFIPVSIAQVRESPIATKRSFLERKGLTAAEIDEAIRRVGSTGHSSTLATPVPAQGGSSGAPSGLITYQPQATAGLQTRQPAYTAATGMPTSSQQASPQHFQGTTPTVAAHAIMPAKPAAQPEPLRWTQVCYVR
jgi:hypothetical protein